MREQERLFALETENRELKARVRELLQKVQQLDGLLDATREDKTDLWNRGRRFERDRISDIVKSNIEHMEGNPEGYTASELAMQKRLLEFINPEISHLDELENDPWSKFVGQAQKKARLSLITRTKGCPNNV